MTEQINELLGWVGEYSFKTLLPAVAILAAGLLVIRLVNMLLKKILQYGMHQESLIQKQVKLKNLRAMVL